MSYIGLSTLMLHYLAGESKSLRGIVGFLKWLSLMVGVPQAAGFFLAWGQDVGITNEQHQLLLVWSLTNIAAFFVVREAEQKRLRGKGFDAERED